MNPDPNDPSDNPYRPKALKVPDPHHDAQLYRDVAIVNAETVVRLGTPPSGALPAQPRRKPNLPRAVPSAVSAATHAHEDDPMKLHQVAAAALLPLAVAGCSHSIDAGSATARLHPHPVKRYEVIATSAAPGPWDSIDGYIGYDVINRDCVPEDSFTGGQNVPNTGIVIDMTRVNDNTWRGYFYRDALQDEDYFGLGVCRWDVTDVSTRFTAHSISFSSGSLFNDFLRNSSQTEYFKKSSYSDRNLVGIGALQFLPSDPEVIKQPDAFFPITVTVKEVTP